VVYVRTASFVYKEVRRKEICSDFPAIILKECSILERIVTIDKTWVFQYDLETNR